MKKRIITILIILTLLSALAGCTQEKGVCFYYLRYETDYLYGAADAVITVEERDIGADHPDLNYLLRLYLEGPLADTLRSPFPKGTYLLNTQLDGDTLTVILSTEFSTLEDMDLTLAAGCMASTCFALTEAQQVIITSSNSESITLTRSSLVLLDDSAATQATGQ